MGWHVFWIALVVLLAGAGAYRYSLERNPTRKCHSCDGSGRNRAWLWTYAEGPCRARTLLSPRATCGEGAPGGRVPRYGRRVMRLEDKSK